jgi:replicative DNA helicase
MSALALPACPDVERLVLGAVMLDDAQMHDVRGVLALDDFSVERHRRIWRRACELYDAGKPVDRVTVALCMDQHGEREPDTLAYLSSIEEGLPRLPNLASYVQTVHDKAVLRRIMLAAEQIQKRCQMAEEPPQAILDSLAALSVDIAPSPIRRGLVSARDLVDRVGLSEILAPRIQRGISFPWEWMNYATCGMLPGELWVLAALTSAGKTSAAVQTAVHAARAQSKAVAIFSLEMAGASILQRAVWQVSRVDSGAAKRGKLNAEERRRATDAVNELYSLRLYFDDSSYSVMEIHARLRRLRSQGPLALIVVDYLQLLRDGGRHGSRAEAVGANARALKLMAGDFECPVLLLSQFNRDSAKTKGNEAPRRPELHDLKESGDIECHANGVWFIHRTSQEDADRIPVEFILPKQRDGRRNIMQDFWFSPGSQRFDAKEVSE